MGPIVRHESTGIEFFDAYPKCIKQFEKVGWMPFLQKFQRCDGEVSKTFARSFDRVEAHIGDVQLVLTESFIVEATRISRDR